jgi:hypothetical protein
MIPTVGFIPTARNRGARVALRDQDEHHPPRVDEPRGAHPDNIGDAIDEEPNPLGLQLRSGGVDVVADQSDMRQPVIRQARIGTTGAAGGVEVLNHLKHPVAVVVEPDDRRLHLGIYHQLAHVVADRVAVHHVGRRKHAQAEHIAVERHRGLAVRDANAGVSHSGNHVLNDAAEAVIALPELLDGWRRSVSFG